MIFFHFSKVGQAARFWMRVSYLGTLWLFLRLSDHICSQGTELFFLVAIHAKQSTENSFLSPLSMQKYIVLFLDILCVRAVRTW